MDRGYNYSNDIPFEDVVAQNFQERYENDGTSFPASEDQYQSHYEGQSPYEDGYEETIPDILLLNHFCAHAYAPQDDSDVAKVAADNSWAPVREWMRTHSAEEVRAAAEQRDDAGKTALHFACQNAPPIDVVDVFLAIAIDVVQWPDSFGWLPIHYAW
jgi:hypothetical protein